MGETSFSALHWFISTHSHQFVFSCIICTFNCGVNLFFFPSNIFHRFKSLKCSGKCFIFCRRCWETDCCQIRRETFTRILHFLRTMILSSLTTLLRWLISEGRFVGWDLRFVFNAWATKNSTYWHECLSCKNKWWLILGVGLSCSYAQVKLWFGGCSVQLEQQNQ